MNILLVNPSQEKVYGFKMPPIYPPLGLLYIGAALKKAGHNVRLTDIDVDNINTDDFKKILKDFKPALVGITSVTPTINNALIWAAAAKKYDSAIKTVFGGIHATIAPLVLAASECVDYVVAGEGERTIIELADFIAKGREPAADMAGLAYKDGGKPVMTKPRELIAELDDIEFPDYSLLKSLESYVPPDAISTPVATIMTSRGCNGDCTFCCTKQIFTRRVRMRSAANIIREISSLVKNYGVKEIHIADDTFTVNKKRVLDFCLAVREAKLDINFEFMNGVRADCIDEERLKALKSIKIRNIGVGVESGNAEVLKLAKKNISLDRVRETFSLAKRMGFETWAFFIIGLPGETAGSIKESIAFAKEIAPDFVKFLILKPYPGSEVFKYLSERGLVDCYNYDMYGVYTGPVHHLPGLTKEALIKWQKKAFLSYYMRPSVVFNHIKRLRSLTQLKIAVRGFIFIMANILKKNK